ncbi:MAG: riboflavin kinase [bacterium]
MTQIITGIVVKGAGIASGEFGVPTANLNLAGDPQIDFGVYAVRVRHEENDLHGALCYGIGSPPKFEVHIFGYSADLVGSKISVEIVEKVSELVEWVSAEQMRKKILCDLKLAREALELN